MMNVRLCTLKCFVIFLGIVSLVLIARRNLYRKRTFPMNAWNTFSQERIKMPFSNPPVQFCNSKRLPDSIARLNSMYDDVKTFAMFIGYSQSIESLTGAILDAHPNILIPQEYDVIGSWKMYQDKKLRELGQQKYMLFFFLHYISTFQAVFRNQANKPSQFWAWTSKVDSIQYNFVPDTWQGRTDGKIKVIGDTSGGVTSKKLAENQENFALLEEIQNVVGIPLKFVHIISNPYDVIASKVIGRSGSDIMVDNRETIQDAMKDVFAVVQANERIRKLYGDAVLDISTDQLIINPRETLKQICSFIEVTCYESYLDKVEDSLYKKITRTRDRVVWTNEEKDWVAAEMKKYSFFESFDFQHIQD